MAHTKSFGWSFCMLCVCVFVYVCLSKISTVHSIQMLAKFLINWHKIHTRQNFTSNYKIRVKENHTMALVSDIYTWRQIELFEKLMTMSIDTSVQIIKYFDCDLLEKQIFFKCVCDSMMSKRIFNKSIWILRLWLFEYSHFCSQQFIRHIQMLVALKGSRRCANRIAIECSKLTNHLQFIIVFQTFISCGFG